MIRTALSLLLMTVGSFSYATCHNNRLEYAAPISVDLSDKLTPATPQWTGTFSTQYSGSFDCSVRNSRFGYTQILNTDDRYATILSFQSGKYNVRAEIISDVPDKTLSASGRHSASELNVPMTVRFSLVTKSGTTITDDTARLNDVLIVTDLSGMSVWETIAWPLKQLAKILQWLFNGFHWPYDVRDMYGQPMLIKYAPKLTTCSFTNSGLSVVLPTLGKQQILNGDRPGFTPFNLNMRCDGISVSGTSVRAIDMFLSSSTLLSTDPTVMTDSSAGAAKGVGLRLVKRDAGSAPVVFSPSDLSKSNATSLFYVAVGGTLSNQFTIPMGVYYYPWSPANLTQGNINTTATLNIIYP